MPDEKKRGDFEGNVIVKQIKIRQRSSAAVCCMTFHNLEDYEVAREINILLHPFGEGCNKLYMIYILINMTCFLCL